jgi:hypothetical protein
MYWITDAQDKWQTENDNQSSQFESNVYEAITAGQQKAIACKDKTAINTFKAIVSKVGKGNGDPRDRLTEQEQSFIRRWYLKSLEQ